MSLTTVALWPLRLVARWVGGWVGANPLRTAGGTGAAVALAVMCRALDVQFTANGVTAARTGPEALAAFALAHPAYALLAAGGLLLFLFGEE